MKKKIILSIVIVVLLGISIILVPINNPSKKNSIRIYKPNVNVKTMMELWESDNNGFEFQESELSYSKNPRFIGKSRNKNCKDLIIIQGKNEAFSIRYSAPITDENNLEPSSMENMKNMLKIMSCSIDKLDNMEGWEKLIKEHINNYEEKYTVIDDNRISFYINIYLNSLVLEIEKVDYHKYNNGEYKD